MKLAIPSRVPPAGALGRVHFVGIGGAGLSGIARIMCARGIPVSGSDAADSPTLDALRELGASVHVGHAAEHVRDVDTVVVSTAVREDNPEVVEARRRGLLLLPRSAGLAAVMEGRRVVAVAGTHGKTTTTSLLTVALQAAGAEPTYAIGGDLTATGTNAAEGTGDLFIAEADESDGAFLAYHPHAAIVTNVDADHLDHFGSVDAYRQAFRDFLDTIDPDGFLVCCVDDPGAAELAVDARRRGLRVLTVGGSPEAELQAVDVDPTEGRTRCTVEWNGRQLGVLTLQIPGRHYLMDALAALGCGLLLRYEYDDLAAGLAGFTGTRRRMERKGEVAGIRVYDSYAHHPMEIRGDLAAARLLAGSGRVLVAFQPHLVSRTRIFAAQMGEALGAADRVVVLDVYLAREDPDPEVTGALVAAAVPLPPDRVSFVPEVPDAAAALAAAARPGDLLLTLGAGTVTQAAPRVLELLREHNVD